MAKHAGLTFIKEASGRRTMNEPKIYRRKKLLAKTGPLKLYRINDRWIMQGGTWGGHVLHEPCYNERVAAHWQGYCTNNGVKVAPYPTLNRANHDF